MGYSAYKLWNIGNYEKRNYKELGMERFPNWYDQKKRLKDNFFYKNLPSQTAQDVLKLLQEAWNSYSALLKNKKIDNPRPPRYKKDIMSVTFLKDAIKQEKDSIRLSIPKQLKLYLKERDINADYIYLKTKRFSDITIKEIQIKFIDKDSFLAIAVYQEEDREMIPENGRYLSVDMGIRNSFTCYDSAESSFIVNGFLNATHYYDKKISYYQAVSDKQQVAKGIEYPKKSHRVIRLHQKKKRCVNDFLHKATRYIADYCHDNDIYTVIIGDITGIREGANIGKNNQQLHSFPYKKAYKMLEYKLKRMGITLKQRKETYSSQCPPDSEKVSKKDAEKKNRKHRGLYVTQDAVYNADCVGAYNILRLYLQQEKREIPAYGNLSSPKKVTV